MFSLFKKKIQPQSESKITAAEFWNWFDLHKSELEEFIDSSNRNFNIFNQMTREMKRFNSLLFPELSKSAEGKYVLIITPDGITEGVEPTIELEESCTDFSDWEIKRFRQPTDELSLELGPIQFPTSDIEIVPELDKQDEKVHLRIFIRNMNIDTEKYQHLAFLYLDHILGEFNVITRVGYIDFYHLDKDQSVDGSISLLELRGLIDKELY